MNPHPRDLESALLDRCVAAARGLAGSAATDQEANVFALAAEVLQTHYPKEAAVLSEHAQAYFARHLGAQLSAGDVIRRRWVANLPRLRDMLSDRLRGLRP